MRYINISGSFDGPAPVMDSGTRNDLLGAVQVARDQYAKDRDVFLKIADESGKEAYPWLAPAGAKRLADEFDRKVQVMKHLMQELE